VLFLCVRDSASACAVFVCALCIYVYLCVCACVCVTCHQSAHAWAYAWVCRACILLVKMKKIHKQKMSLSEYTSTPCRVREEEGGGRGGKMETTEQCASTPCSGVGEGLGFR
jgi:hypothetical protein